MAFLSLDRVQTRFPSRRGPVSVLRGLSLDVDEGEFVAVIGASGAGKTTLVSVIAGLTPVHAGSVTLDGVPITAPGPDRAVVFQQYSLLPWLSVLENVRLAVDAVAPARSAVWRETRAMHFVGLVGLAAAAHKRPRELSGGMRQRVAVARALATEPRILLLDEPFSALDALTRATLQDELASLWAADRKTILMITNDVDEAIVLADRIHVLRVGRGTLTPAIPVGLARPRRLRALASDPEYRRIRRAVASTLADAGRSAA